MRWKIDGCIFQLRVGSLFYPLPVALFLGYFALFVSILKDTENRKDFFSKHFCLKDEGFRIFNDGALVSLTSPFDPFLFTKAFSVIWKTPCIFAFFLLSLEQRYRNLDYMDRVSWRCARSCQNKKLCVCLNN